MKRTTVFKQLIINIMLPLLATLLILAYYSYVRNKELLLDTYKEKNLSIQKEIKTVLGFQDISLELVEKSMNKRLATLSQILVYEYFSNTDSIEKVGLEQIRKDLGMKQDIYVINKDGEIVNTTFLRDLHFNLYSIDEKHEQFLRSIFNSDEFIPEKLSLERTTKKLKKYTYQPTSDGNYIIELGAYSSEANRIVDAYRSHLEKLSEVGYGVVAVDLFLGRDDPVSFIRDAELMEDHVETYIKTYDDKRGRTIIEKVDGRKLHFEYVYMDRVNTDLYEGSVIRIITDRSGEARLIFNELGKLVLIFGVAMLLLGIMIYKRARAITQPIHQLEESAKKIEKGSMDTRAEVVGNNEVTTLAEHFNSMIVRLQKYYNELEQKVAERTAEVVAQKEKIEQQQKHLTDSIHYAKRIQSAILPSDLQMENSLGAHFHLYMPKDIVSGDFYWLSKREDKVLLTAADCTGHGVPGAFMSMIGASLLNKIVNENLVLQPSLVLDALRDGVINSLNKEGQEGATNDGMDMVLISLDRKAMKIEFAGANNPLYVVRNGEIVKYKGDTQPVGGGHGTGKAFANTEVEVQKGDMVYLTSDGYQDQFGGDKKLKFMVGKFKKLLVEIADLPLEKQRSILLERHLTWKGDLAQVDDILVIGIRI